MEWDTGQTGLFVTTTGEHPGTNRMELHGDRGRMVIEENTITLDRTVMSVAEFNLTSEERWKGPEVETTEIAVPDGGWKWDYLHRNFLDALLHDAPMLSPGVEGIRSLELANAIALSGGREQTVTLPLDGDAYEQFLNEKIAEAAAKKN